jgi:hypothetical protein
MPPLAALLPFLGKAVAGAKGLVAGAKGIAAGKAATQLAIPGLTATAKSGLGGLGSRMAGTEFVKNAAALMPKTAAEWGMRVAPDAIFGTLAGAMTPGDLGDKLIAGTAATAGGALGGLGLRAAVGGVAPGVMKNAVVDITSEMVGGIGGDMAAQGVADSILRIKGGGTTPYEKMAADQQKELEQQILQQYLSGKGGYPMGNGMV